MNAVDPIKSLEDIRKMKEFLAKKPRNALLFSFGINSGLRISDILALNVGRIHEAGTRKTANYSNFTTVSNFFFYKFPFKFILHTH